MKKAVSVILSITLLCSVFPFDALAGNNTAYPFVQRQENNEANQQKAPDISKQLGQMKDKLSPEQQVFSDKNTTQELMKTTSISSPSVLPNRFAVPAQKVNKTVQYSAVAEMQPIPVMEDVYTESKEANANVLLGEPIPTLASASDFSFDTTTGTIIKYLGPGGAVEIPDKIREVAVKSIGDRAFYTCIKLTSITIPSGVTNIGNYAFSSCINLTGITIPGSVTSIGEGAFYYCTKLSSISIPNSVTRIKDSTFRNCSSLTSVALPEGLTNIEIMAFGACSGLTGITIPNTVTSIGEGAFGGCSGLPSIIIPESVTSIGDGAFGNCTKLTSINIPKGVTSIGKSTFSGCSKLTSITIPDSVTSIGSDAMSGCLSLTNITIPNSVTSIGSFAFYYCNSLTKIAIPSSVTSIGEFAFYYCSKLVSVSIPRGVTSIKGGTFSYCSSLTSITLPDNLTSIEVSAFNACSSLTGITIPNKVTRIGDRVFANCSNLTDVTLPDSITSIGADAFYYCDNLTGITIPSSLTCIGYRVFRGCHGLKSITIPDSVIKIEQDAFYECSSLSSIHMPNGVTDIGVMAFYNCRDLTNVVLPDTVTSIRAGAFQGCGLRGINIPEGVKNIEDDTFHFCEYLTSITIPHNVTNIGSFAFAGCSSLTEITIPDKVTNIGDYAFGGCYNLISITISDSVTGIGNNAFYNCERLTLYTILGCYADSYAISHGIPVKYNANDDTAAIEVTIPSAGDSSQYGNRMLTLIDNTDNTRRCVNITQSLQYYFGGLVPGHTYKVTLTNIFGDIIGSMDNITVSKGVNRVSLNELKETETVNIIIRDNQGKDVTNKTTIKWYDANNNYILQGNSVRELLPEKSLFYVVELDNTLGIQYIVPPRQGYTVKQGVNNVELTLTPIPTVILSGKVTDETTGDTLQDAAVSVSQELNGKYPKNTFATTDSNGLFTVQVYKDVANVTVSKNNYANRMITGVHAGFTGDSCNMGEIKLSEITGAKITLEMSYTYSALTGTTPIKLDYYDNIMNIRFELFNQTQNKQISNFSVQHPYIVLLEGTNPGDVISITAASRDNACKPEQILVSLDISLKATAHIDFIQNGSLKAACSSSANSDNEAIIYDQNGKYLKCFDFGNTTVASDVLPEGNYNVVFIGKSIFFNTMQNLSDLSEVGLIENVDYIKRQFQIRSGIITEISSITIPLLDESKLYYTDSVNTSFTANKTKAAAGSYFSLRSQYSFKSTAATQVSNAKLIYEFPDNCSFLQNSVLIGNYVSSNYGYSNNTLTVPVTAMSDIVRFCVVPITAGKFSINAFVQFDIGGTTRKQPIGTVDIEATALTIDVPEKTGQKAITVSGVTIPGSDITVYDNHVVAGQTKSLQNGSWSLEIELYKPYTCSFHEVYAEVNSNDGIKRISETKPLIYDMNYIGVSKVTMINTAHAASLNPCEYVTVFDFLNPPAKASSYFYWPMYPTFTFIVEFTKDDPSAVSNVYVNVWTSSGNTVSLPAGYDASKRVWAATGNFEANNLPKNVSVSYECTEGESVLDVEYQKDLQRKFEDEFAGKIEIGSEYDSKTITNADGSQEIQFFEKSDPNNILLKFKYKKLDYSSFDLQSLAQNGYISEKTSTGGVIYCKNHSTAEGLSFTSINTESKTAYDITIAGPVAKDVLAASTELKSMEYEMSSMLQQDTNIIDYSSITASIAECAAQIAQIEQKTNTIAASIERISRLAGKGLGILGIGAAAYQMDAHFKQFEMEYQTASIQLNDECIPENVKAAAYNCLSATYNCFIALEKQYITFNSSLFALGMLSGLTGPAGILASSLLAAYGMSENAIMDLERKMLMQDLQLIVIRAQLTRNKNCKKKPGEVGPPAQTDATPLIDPSGYIYEAVASNRLQGVTATIFYKQNLTDTTSTLWDAAEYQQENPLATDINGAYAWDVPQGYWQVKYEKDGYQSVFSDWLPVPPPQVDINIGMVSYAQTHIDRVNGYADYIELTFDKFMLVSTITTDNIKIKRNGADCAGTIQLVNAEANPKNSAEQFVSKIRFIPVNGQFKQTDVIELTVSFNVKSYAQVNMASDYTAAVPITAEPRTIAATESLAVDYGKNGNVVVSVLPKEAGIGKKIIAVSSSPSIATVAAESTLDSTGSVSVRVTADMAGVAYVTFSLEGTDLQAVTKVQVGMPEAGRVVKPIANPPAGWVKNGTRVELLTTTEGAVIYYTTDGTCPRISTTRQVYTQPIVINKSMVILAYAMKAGYADSDVASYEYNITGILGDINEDGTVNIDDLVILTHSYGSYSGSNDDKWDVRADLNKDGRVDVYDLTIFQKQYNKFAST